MAKRAHVPAPYPVKGLSDSLANLDQPPLTTREARNERVIDPITRRLRGGQRAGMVKHCVQPTGNGSIRCIVSSIVDDPKQTYTDLGNNATIDFSQSTPSGLDVRGIARDKQSNLYAIDGNVSIIKLNSEGTQLWKVTLPASDAQHVIRAIAVDEETGLVFAGVSTGGDSTTAKMWAYRQLDDNKVDMLWQIEPGGFIERIKLKDTVVFALLSFPDRNRSYVRTYGFADTEAPGQQAEWEVPSPANDMDISPKDDSVFVASDANPIRGLDPRSPLTTTSSVDFTPLDLNQYKKRIWAWFDASDRSTLSIQTLTSDSGDDGGEVIVFGDKSGNGRNFYANQGGSPTPPVPPQERGPTYRAVGLNGMPTLSFSGATYNGANPNTSTAGRSMLGQGASSTDRAYRAEQLSPLPTYKGAQFVVIMVVKSGIDETIRGLLSLNAPGSNTLSRMLAMNRRPDNNLPGTIPMPGSVQLYELNGSASDTGASTPAAGGPDITSAPSRVSPGPLTGSGVAVITWICDGGVHDVFGTATRSTLRINGHPVDRWQSVPFSTTLPITLGIANLGSSGHARFAGEVAEIIVLSDWYDQNGFQQRLVTTPGYPDSAWSADGDSEVERIEGYLANKWGIAHELETGQAGWAHLTAQPANGETFTLDGVTYTFTTGALTAANQVKISTGFRETSANLYYAINRIGNPGIDYDQRTVKHPTFICLAPFETQGATVYIGVRSISPYQSPVALASSSGGTITWDATPTSDVIAGLGHARGWYPHPFTLQKTNDSMGGPPSKNANASNRISDFLLLQSKFGMLTKWSSTSGKLVWTLTTGRTQVAMPASLRLEGFGGVGFACRVDSAGDIYSVGPRVLLQSSGNVSVNPADIVDIRKVTDAGTTPNDLTKDPWVLSVAIDPFDPGGFQYHYPRIDVDAFDNLYVPIAYTGLGAYESVSVVGYRKASAAGFAVEFIRYQNLPFLNDTFAVLADPNHPDFPTGDTIQHGEFLYLGTLADTTDPAHNAIFKLKLIDIALNSGSQRDIDLLVVNQGTISIVTPTTVTPVSGGFLDPNADFIDAVQLYGDVFFTDGKSYLVFDGKLKTLSKFVSKTSGLIQPRCKLMAAWNGRLVLARSADNAHFWSMSQHGNPFGWDLFPPTSTETDAVAGSTSQTGISPDIINTVIAYNTDILIFGCDHSIYKMSGDPQAGGRFDQISNTIGMAFGNSHAQDPDGYLYFADNRGEIYRMSPGGGQKGLSRNRINKRIQAVDLNAYRLELLWNLEDDGLHVFQVPYGPGGVPVAAWFWERATDSWHEDTFGSLTNTTVQPTYAYIQDGDDPQDRIVLLGCEDGFLRRWSTTATSDDGLPIDSFVTIGPLVPKGSYVEWVFTDIDAVMATEQSGPNWYLFGSKTADNKGDPFSHGRFLPGRNATVLSRVRGAVSFIQLGLADKNARWAYEDIQMQAVPMGRKRAIS